jgi:hypothetical protein
MSCASASSSTLRFFASAMVTISRRLRSAAACLSMACRMMGSGVSDVSSYLPMKDATHKRAVQQTKC